MPRQMINGCELYFESRGSGEPLVLVHGSWTDHTSWQFVTAGFAETHHIVAYDRRGHSRSERSATPGTRRTDEDDLAGLIEMIDLGPANVVANSYGASIALGLAARRPELMRAIVAHEPPLLDVADPLSTLGRDAEHLRTSMRQLAADIRSGRHEESAARFMEEVALGPGAWTTIPEESRRVFASNAPTFAATIADPRWAAVPHLGTATLLTDGDASPAWLPAIVHALATGPYRSAARHTFRGAGHAPHLTHAAELVAVATAFLTSSRDAVTLMPTPVTGSMRTT